MLTALHYVAVVAGAVGYALGGWCPGVVIAGGTVLAYSVCVTLTGIFRK